MKLFFNLVRLYKIHAVLIRYGVVTYVLAKLNSHYTKLLYLHPLFWLPKYKKISNEDRINLSLERLGPLFIKFGQILATRSDLFAPELIASLLKLQDRVTPIADEQARAIIDKAYNNKSSELFLNIASSPIGSASIAQVHRAKLKTGEQVVIKFLRPGIQGIVKRDISLLYLITGLAEKLFASLRKFKLSNLITELEYTLNKELDLSIEAACADKLRSNFNKSAILYVPKVYFDLTKTNILVQEEITGIAINDIEALKAKKVNLKKLAEHGVEIFFTQVFRDKFFHADMHAGNIFVGTDDPEKPKYLAIDFGIMGTLNDFDQHYLAQNLMAFFNADYEKVARLHLESGWVDSNTRLEDLTFAIMRVCAPIFAKDLNEISFGKVLLGLLNTAQQFNMQVQPQLFLLQKTLVNIEGLGRKLYPELNLWRTAKPTLEKYLKEKMGLKAFMNNMCNQMPDILATLPQLPARVNLALGEIKDIRRVERINSTYLCKINRQITICNISIIILILVSILLIY